MKHATHSASSVFNRGENVLVRPHPSQASCNHTPSQESFLPRLPFFPASSIIWHSAHLKSTPVKEFFSRSLSALCKQPHSEHPNKDSPLLRLYPSSPSVEFGPSRALAGWTSLSGYSGYSLCTAPSSAYLTGYRRTKHLQVPLSVPCAKQAVCVCVWVRECAYIGRVGWRVSLVSGPAETASFHSTCLPTCAWLASPSFPVIGLCDGDSGTQRRRRRRCQCCNRNQRRSFCLWNPVQQCNSVQVLFIETQEGREEAFRIAFRHTDWA